jgi:hypothetical protein
MAVFMLFDDPDLEIGFIGTAMTPVLGNVLTATNNTVLAELYPISPATTISQVQYQINGGAVQNPTSFDGTNLKITLGDLGSGQVGKMNTLTITATDNASGAVKVLQSTSMIVQFYWGAG